MVKVRLHESANERTTLATPTAPPQTESAPGAPPPTALPTSPQPGPATVTPPPPPPPALPESPPPKGRISRNTGIALAAIVVIAIVLLALLLTGVIPGLSKAPSSSTPGALEYKVTFSESGLPSGKQWSITLAGTTDSSTTNTLVFSEKNGSYPFTIDTVSGYAASPASGTATVNGASINEPITFTVGYPVTFSETGLPSGAMWSVTLETTTLSSSTSSIAFSEANGTYSYAIPTSDGYTPVPASGSVTIAGAPQTVTVTFRSVPPGDYEVTFNESGLPSGTNWSVTLAGTSHSSVTATITFVEPNNTYSYTVGSVPSYRATPSSGNVTVHGVAVAVTVIFAMTPRYSGPQYPVTFEQTGLPSTDLWAAYSEPKALPLVEFGAFSAGPKIEYSAPNGSYEWSVYPYAVTGNGTYYLNVPENGTFNVSGQPVTVKLSFVETFPVNFTVTGLANFYEWNATINGSLYLFVGNGNFSIDLPNGTYQYTVSAFAYVASPAGGFLTVQNGSVSFAIVFIKETTYSADFTETGLSVTGSWLLTLYYPGGFFETTNTSGNPIDESLPVGTYYFQVRAVYVDYWAASPASGNITVTTAGASQPIVFSAISTYSVTVTESGLAPSTSWSLTLNESEGSATAPGTITLDAPAGPNLYYGYASGYRDVMGNVSVSTGTNSLMVTFIPLPPPPASYNVTFNETGLPSLASWEVLVLSQGSYLCPAVSCYNYSFAGSPINLSLPSGNYTWIAETDAGNFTASPMAGFVSVDGASPPIAAVTYVNSSADYLVAFSEASYSYDGVAGLPNGTSWSVTIGGHSESTAGMFLFFLLPNGTTNAYTISAPTGYVAIQSAGNVTGYFDAYQSLFSFFISVSPEVVVAFEPAGLLPGDFLTPGGATLGGILLENGIALARFS